jgi:hypothetical protein
MKTITNIYAHMFIGDKTTMTSDKEIYNMLNHVRNQKV